MDIQCIFKNYLNNFMACRSLCIVYISQFYFRRVNQFFFFESTIYYVQNIKNNYFPSYNALMSYEFIFKFKSKVIIAK